eukprot:TRINITY_DN2495_c0_g1_i10.p1 TRINITY_DN2495_c0_g1~~TRINITY_DN2495_c0_g1_i10.p1  ORF type:complete len:513 (+),score=105.19 TRINITY_DN2495_c0_g1_i10:258-1796(+)
MQLLEPVLQLWNTVATGALVVPVQQIDDIILSLDLPLTVDVVKFIITILLAIPLGFANRMVPCGNPRHVYNFVVGMVFAQGCYGPGWLHLTFSSTVTYLIMLAAPRSVSHKMVFLWIMGYIGGVHVYRMYTDWLGWQLDFSGPQMMATVKLTSLAFNFHDGKPGRTEPERRNDLDKIVAQMKEIDAEVKSGDLTRKSTLTKLRGEKLRTSLAMDALPGPLEFYGWVHNFSTYQAGPALEIQEYERVNNPNQKQGYLDGCAMAVAKHFGIGLFMLVLAQYLLMNFPFGDLKAGIKSERGLLSASFLELGPLERLGFAFMASFGLQCNYLGAWKWGEAAAVAFGYGSAGGAWNGAQNSDLRLWFLSENMSSASKAWNQKTQVWLQTYTYFRVPGGRFAQLMSTYAVSAFWHGFYPGFYLAFFTLGLYSVGQDNMIKHVRPYFLHSTAAKKVYDVLGVVVLQWVKTTAILPFAVYTLENSYEAHKRLYFLGLVAPVIGLLVPFIVPPPKPKAKQS